MKKLTTKQNNVLKYINKFIKDFKIPPTCQEIRAGLGYASANSITGYLNALEKKGYIKRTPKTARSIVVLQA